MLKDIEQKCEWDVEVKPFDADNMLALVNCFACKKPEWVKFPADEYRDALMLTLLKAHVCRACLAAAGQHKQEKNEAEKRAEAEAAYMRRLKGANFIKNYLDWDASYPGANIELFKWVEKRRYGSMFLTGYTGLCKTRILQYWGREAVKYQSVYYSTASALLNAISSAYSEKCTAGDEFVEKINCYDLLIIDDLGKEIGSSSQIGRLWDIIDSRYIANDQAQKIRDGKINLIYAKELDRSHGWQLWISTNLEPEDIFNRYEKNNNRAGDPLINRLKTISENNIWEPKA